ncbi:MAG TPA: hypothetical protein VM100_08510 [Longimicrobiales bacterium]|nr:hypothetical protein [Longimicrobiales bacterium]
MDTMQYDDKTRIEFATSSLYHADGFESGNLLKKYFPHLSASDLRDLLADTVLRLVMPQLEQQVSIMVIPTSRNPVRVTRVGTESVVWHTPDAGTGPTITPAVVTVEVARVRERIPKHAAKAPTELKIEPDATDKNE